MVISPTMSLQRGPVMGRVWSPPLGLGLMVGMVLIFSCMVGQGQGQIYPAERFPDPLQNPYECNTPRGEPSLICDAPKYLTEFQHDELQVILKSIRERGTCPCTAAYYCETSYTVAIAIVPAISTSGGRADARSSLLEFATTLQTSVWKHGTTCGENSVIAYSVADNIIVASFGTQARAKLTDECANKIQMRVDEYLRNGQIFEGLILIAREYSQYFKGEKTCTLPVPSSPMEGVYVALIFMCLLIFFGLTYLCIVSFKKCSQNEMLKRMHPIAHIDGHTAHHGPTAHPKVNHGHIGPAVVPGHPTGDVTVVNRSDPMMMVGGAMSSGAQGTMFSLPYGAADGMGGAMNADGMNFGSNMVSNITIGGADSGAW